MARQSVWKAGVYCREKGRFITRRKVRKIIDLRRKERDRLNDNDKVVWRDVSGSGECSLSTMRSGWEVINK